VGWVAAVAEAAMARAAAATARLQEGSIAAPT
jgi:hypothetical protein